MKRTYSATRSRRPFWLSGGWWSVGALLFAVVFVAYRYAFPGAFLHTVAPFTEAGASVSFGVHGFTARFADAAKLTAKVDVLTEQNTALSAQNRALSQQLADVGALSGAGVVPAGIVAGVVARPPESPYDTLILAAGSAQGVTNGMEVFGPGNTPFGRITSVTSDFSRATLFSAPGQMLSTWIGALHTPVELRGVGGGSFAASLPRSAGVLAGDIVYAPGPGALPIGVVSKLDGDPSAGSVSLDIVPVLNPYTITWVLLRDTGAEFLTALRAATSTTP